MQHQELELFLDLARTLHFGHTSRNCNISPSALSRAIGRLEAEAGARLFLRDRRGVALTEAGREFRHFAADTIEKWHELKQHLSSDQQRVRGEVRIYASVTACHSVLPGILGRFRSDYPEVHLNLKTGDPARALDMVERDEVDVAVAALPDRIGDTLEAEVLVTTPLVFAAPQMRCAVRDTLEAEPVPWQNVPFVLSERGLARERISRWFRSREIEPVIYAQVAGNEAILAMVALGCGVGLVPELVVEKSPLRDQLEVIRPEPALEPYRVGVAVRSRRLAVPAVRALWKTVQQGRG
jgi:LysR family positive regulator for ilvC